MTLLLLSISLVAVISPMYVEGDTGVADHTTKTKKTETSTTASGSVTELTSGFILKADPPVHTVQHLKNGRTASATYSVRVTASSGFRGKVELSVDGLPEDADAFFNPEEGVPKPVLASILKVLIPPSTPAGIYTLKITGSSDHTSNYATTTLIVEGEATTRTTQKQDELRVSISTDKEKYDRGDEVRISGLVKLNLGASVAGATVSLSVLDPAGEEVHAAVMNTDQAGRYAENFTLPSIAVEGTYTVYATASMTGYKDAYATVTFTVGVSRLPSVRIVNATITMLDGTPSSEFKPGETVVVWTAANNTGVDLKSGNMWIEVLDPDDAPITVVVIVVTIHTGEQAQIGVHVILGSNAKLGTYTVRILVSDAPIMSGGKFLDSKEMAFVVSSDASQTATATTQTTTEIASTSTTESTSTSTTETASTTTSETTSTSTAETA